MAATPAPQVSSIAEGIEELFILSFPLDVPVEEAFAGYALVVMRRDGGALLALPVGLIAMEALQTVSLEDPASDLGPHTVVPVPGVKEADGSLQLLGSDLDVLLVDVSDAVVANLVPMELSDLDPTSVLGFHEDVSYLPDAATLLKLTKEWVASATAERVQFYSADEGGPAEEQTAVPKQKAKAKASTDKPKTVSAAKQVASHIQQISSLLPNMASQLAEIQEEQKNMREAFRLQNMLPPPRGTQTPVTMPMQSFAKMLGAPPRTKQVTFAPPPPKKAAVELDSALNVQEQAEEGDHLSERSPLAMAMLEQSRALTTLVSHLQSGDPLVDSPGVSSGTSSRGSQGREKLQRELSQRSGGFFLAIMQNAFKRMKPASPLPANLEELAHADFSMVQYMERCGGFANAKDLGIVQYALSFVADSAMRSDWEGVREHLSLAMLAIEQAAQDGGRWDLAFNLLLLEDPPPAIWSYRPNAMVAQTGRSRAFCSLCPQRMATVSLAFMKEMDYIAGRRQEMVKKSAPVPLPAQPAPKPKRKGKFPKGKPEAYAEEEAYRCWSS